MILYFNILNYSYSMSRYLFILLALFGGLDYVKGQCQPFNAGFENWIDLTDSFESELTVEIDYPVVLPEGWFSAFRLLDIALSGFIVDFLDSGKAIDFPLFGGVSQYSPGADNTASALRISGDTLLLATDVIQVGPCTSRPAKMTGFYKYEGDGSDTLFIGAVLQKEADLIDTSQAIGFAVFSNFAQDVSRSNSAEFIPFEADFKYNSGETPDTMALLILSSRDKSNPFDTSYFVVDEIRFEGDVVSTRDHIVEHSKALTPNPADAFLDVATDINLGARFHFFDAVGKNVLTVSDISSGKIPIHQLHNGVYFVRIVDGQKNYWQKIAVQH